MTSLYDNLEGLPWFRPELYDDAIARMADAASFPVAYDLWLQRAVEREHELNRAGQATARVYVDDDLFVGYCRVKGFILDSAARKRFALQRVAEGAKANVTDYRNPGFRHGALRLPKRRR